MSEARLPFQASHSYRGLDYHTTRSQLSGLGQALLVQSHRQVSHPAQPLNLSPVFCPRGHRREHDNLRTHEVCAGIQSEEIVIFDKAYVDFTHRADPIPPLR